MRAASRLLLCAGGLAIALLATQPAAHPGLSLVAVASRGPLVHANARDARAVLTAVNMRPGQSVSGLVRIKNGKGGGYMSISAGAPVDTPGAGGGRLSRQLELRIDDVTDPRRPKTIATGHPARACRSLGRVAARASRAYRFTATLPARTGNAYALASTRIDYTWIEGAAPNACSRARQRAHSHHRRDGTPGTHRIGATSRHRR
ncbi:MAG: hypothetical protein ACJ77M_05110 [Thermoleophilaceae bacterium]